MPLRPLAPSPLASRLALLLLLLLLGALYYVFHAADFAPIARHIALVTATHTLHALASGGSVAATTCEAVRGGVVPWEGPQNGLSVCTLVKNEARHMREWVAFHRAQGVGYFVVWDDGSTDGLREELAEFVADGLVRVLQMTDAVELVESLVVRPAVVGRAQRGKACVPTIEEVASLRIYSAECVARRSQQAHVGCQLVAMQTCAAMAKLRGDAWLGVFDADEFLWAPPGGVVAPIANPAAAPAPALLSAPGGLRAALDAAIARSMCMQVSIVGAMWGTSGHIAANWSGLLTATHTRHAPYDAGGHPLPPPWAAGLWPECPPLLCGTARPMKSFVLVTPQLATSGILLHSHMVGLSCYVRHALGATLRYEHFSYLSRDEVEQRKVVMNKNGPESAPWAVVNNTGRASDYFNAVEDHVLSRLSGALAECMAKGTKGGTCEGV